MPIALQHDIVYGPLDSRRFGKSLGINLLPTDQKVCLLDCVYCQYGRTHQGPWTAFPKLERITGQAEKALSDIKERGQRIDWIMIAGNGEPTLHPDFRRIVEQLKSLRDRYLAGIPIGILSNSTTCYRTSIQDSLMQLDGRFMKLDAGDPAVFAKVNQPNPAVRWNQLLDGLYHLRRVVLQSMFVAGVLDNTGQAALEPWIKAVAYIHPETVQVYTVDRPPRDEGICPVPKDRLDRIAGLLTEKTKVPCSVYEASTSPHLN